MEPPKVGSGHQSCLCTTQLAALLRGWAGGTRHGCEGQGKAVAGEAVGQKGQDCALAERKPLSPVVQRDRMKPPKG